MFCSNCGKQLPENVKFCNYCGAQQPVVSSTTDAPRPAAEQQAPAEKPKKKEYKPLNTVICVAIGLCAFLLGKFVLAPAMLPDSKKNPEPNKSAGQTSPVSPVLGGTSTDTPNPEYEAILTDAGIVHFKPIFNMETASFVSVDAQGYIICSDFGYQDDVVLQFIETMYIPISGYTEEQKAELERTTKESYDATMGQLGCVTVSYNMGNNYFTVTLECKGLDREENYSALYDAGFTNTNSSISMATTREKLLAEGAKEK